MSDRRAGGALGRVRYVLWLAGGWLLVGLALLAIITVALTRVGFALSVLAVPLLLAGYGVVRSTQWARILGIPVAGLSAVAVAFVATAPWRGLTPAPGQPQPALDPATVSVAVTLFAAALLLLVGKPNAHW